jgi:hypothetical protein
MCNVHQDKIRVFDILSAHNPKIKLVFRYIAARARAHAVLARRRAVVRSCGAGARGILTGRCRRTAQYTVRQVLPAALDVQGGQAVLCDQLDAVPHARQSAPPYSLPVACCRFPSGPAGPRLWMVAMPVCARDVPRKWLRSVNTLNYHSWRFTAQSLWCALGCDPARLAKVPYDSISHSAATVASQSGMV